MTTSSTPQVPWLYFSGAPPMLIPRSLAHSWRGTADPATGEGRLFDRDNPVTDYDRACVAAWLGTSTLKFMGSLILIFYTQYDQHTWDSSRQILACGGTLPSDEELRDGTWTYPIRWRAEHTDYLLMNPTIDATTYGVPDGFFMPVRLPLGVYTIEYADDVSDYVCCIHRFIRDDQAA